MTVHVVPEYALTREDRAAVAALVQAVFPEEDFGGRAYFKQLPHARLLLKDGDALVGHVALDHRVVTLNGQPWRLLGLIDVAVAPERQGRGLGSRLLAEAEALARTHAHNVDALYLVGDRHGFYRRAGYRLTTQTVTWLAIDQHVNHGLKTERFTRELLVKPLGDRAWPEDGRLDLLGYWY